MGKREHSVVLPFLPPSGSSPINSLSSSTDPCQPNRVHHRSVPFRSVPSPTVPIEPPKFRSALLHRPPLDPDPSISPLPWAGSPGRRWSIRAALGRFLLTPVRKSSGLSARMIARLCPRELFLRCRAVESKSPFQDVTDLLAAWWSTDASLISQNLGDSAETTLRLPSLFLNA